MTSWNYRTVKVTHNDGTVEHGIYEVYYDDDGHPVSRTERPASFVGDTPRECWNAYSLGGRALGTAVLDDAEIGKDTR